jgi:ribosomal protein L21E
MFGFIAIGALAVSAIKCGIQNADMMSKPYRHLDDGTPVYLDRLCNEYINGEKVTVHYDYSKPGVMNTQLVGTKSGKVYVDRRQNFLNKIAKENEEKRQEALSEGKLAYVKLYPKNTIPGCSMNEMADTRLTCECSTGKIISRLECKEDGTCWKYYLTDIAHYHWDPDHKYMSQGYQITKDELQKLNVFNGSHSLFGKGYLYRK